MRFSKGSEREERPFRFSVRVSQGFGVTLSPGTTFTPYPFSVFH
jgi:hypothetical protein